MNPGVLPGTSLRGCGGAPPWPDPSCFCALFLDAGRALLESCVICVSNLFGLTIDGGLFNISIFIFLPSDIFVVDFCFLCCPQCRRLLGERDSKVCMCGGSLLVFSPQWPLRSWPRLEALAAELTGDACLITVFCCVRRRLRYTSAFEIFVFFRRLTRVIQTSFLRVLEMVPLPINYP